MRLIAIVHPVTVRLHVRKYKILLKLKLKKLMKVTKYRSFWQYIKDNDYSLLIAVLIALVIAVVAAYEGAEVVAWFMGIVIALAFFWGIRDYKKNG